jgi:hypothetical protein
MAIPAQKRSRAGICEPRVSASRRWTGRRVLKNRIARHEHRTAADYAVSKSFCTAAVTMGSMSS